MEFAAREVIQRTVSFSVDVDMVLCSISWEGGTVAWTQRCFRAAAQHTSLGLDGHKRILHLPTLWWVFLQMGLDWATSYSKTICLMRHCSSPVSCCWQSAHTSCSCISPLFRLHVRYSMSLSNSFTSPSCGCPLENGQQHERQGPFVSRVSHNSTGIRTWCEQVTLNLWGPMT